MLNKQTPIENVIRSAYADHFDKARDAAISLEQMKHEVNTMPDACHKDMLLNFIRRIDANIVAMANSFRDGGSKIADEATLLLQSGQ